MTIETELAQVAAKSADVAFNLAADLVNEKPGKLLKLLYAFGPKKAVHWVANGRLRLTQVKMQEELFNQCCQAVLENYAKLSKEYACSAESAQSLALSSVLEQAEGDIRLLATVKRSFAYITLVPNLQIGNPGGEAPASRNGKLELPLLSSQA